MRAHHIANVLRCGGGPTTRRAGLAGVHWSIPIRPLDRTQLPNLPTYRFTVDAQFAGNSAT
ncbi:MAG TPA: hypothetical protein PKY77_23910 [Phycisphaerae bacterium]|nr:hypothetical protein [Phycisphaerae bacterium]HSA29806.1 hypothetical protein [Phycisphaerae bacterium]